jgi:hypothetical protein
MPRRFSRRITEFPSAVSPNVRAEHQNQQRRRSPIVPSEHRFQLMLPDATPGIISAYVRSAPMRLLAKIRYNRLVDNALGLIAYSVESHVRATVPEVGLVEIDEMYVGLKNDGRRLVIPLFVQGDDIQINIRHLEHARAFCNHYYPELTVCPLSVQFKRDEVAEVVVLFRLVEGNCQVRISEEHQYRLVPAAEIGR